MANFIHISEEGTDRFLNLDFVSYAEVTRDNGNIQVSVWLAGKDEEETFDGKVAQSLLGVLQASKRT